ncbi:MAG: CBASS cGAMP-activated phospholipase [Antricoccus sp.]
MRILSIDGGGIRGVIPATILAEIERRSGRAIADSFDLIAGTSSGGILACALALPDPQHPAKSRYSAADLASTYATYGPQIFHRDLLRTIITVDGIFEERYSDHGLKEVLLNYFGDAVLSDCRTDVLVTGYALQRRCAFFFRSARAQTDLSYDYALTDVARATSAAPTYFEPAEVTDRANAQSYGLIDGGVFANNPAMCAISEAKAAGEQIDLMLSMGTGAQNRPISVRQARDWGKLQWATRIIDVVFDGVSETVDYQAQQLVTDRFTRFQAELIGASDALDDASEANIASLRAVANKLISEKSADIDRIAQILAIDEHRDPSKSKVG